MIVTSALIIWKGLMCVTGSESPVVVVLSGSMEPGFKRGDILFLHMSKDPIRAGEIVVFNVDGREIPIVHRVIKVHERQDTGEVDILTKGDNNFGDDRLLYAHGQLWLQRHHIMGRAVGPITWFMNMGEVDYMDYVHSGILNRQLLDKLVDGVGLDLPIEFLYKKQKLSLLEGLVRIRNNVDIAMLVKNRNGATEVDIYLVPPTPTPELE
ncbi:Signal peptidase I [Forsythia ovata]|uniref:Signal peptidase complex catalytic subunit SEC11 n=1 Tax=Forsythia ovata TaxID=205694 RepID=A0ABD1SKN5_9LAMI